MWYTKQSPSKIFNLHYPLPPMGTCVLVRRVKACNFNPMCNATLDLCGIDCKKWDIFHCFNWDLSSPPLLWDLFHWQNWDFFHFTAFLSVPIFLPCGFSHAFSDIHLKQWLCCNGRKLRVSLQCGFSLALSDLHWTQRIAVAAVQGFISTLLCPIGFIFWSALWWLRARDFGLPNGGKHGSMAHISLSIKEVCK